MTQKLNITIPDGVQFADLKLARKLDGNVTFDWAPIERICEASGAPIATFRDAPEDNVAGLIVQWYLTHLQRGGASDPVADEITAEVLADLDPQGSA